MNRNFPHLYFHPSIFNQICFGICVLVSSATQQVMLNASVYLPITLFVLFTAARLFFAFIPNTSYQHSLYGDMIDPIFYFWAMIIIGYDLFFIFVMNHLIITEVEERRPFAVLKRIGIVAGIMLGSIIRRVQYKSDWETVVSSAILQLLCTATAIAVGKLMETLRADDIDKLREFKKRIRSRDSILSALSHELRTPLTMIKSSGEILIEERPGKVNEVQKTFLKTIVRNTIRLIEITENILARIKVETTWLKLKLAPLDIRTIVRDVISQMNPMLKQEKKEIRLTHPKLIATVMADENWIAQVMINLIHNSKKNIGPNGRILVNIKENEQFVVVSVSDDGEGIEDKDKEHVYNEFYSKNGKSHGEAEGIGMGLAIVKFVIERHHGKIYMGSIAGLGTIFSFALKKETV